MSMHIEVVFALAHEQKRILLHLPLDSTVRDALQASGLQLSLPQIEFAHFGVWSRPVAADTTLRDGDLVEIYRPLIADPKEIRRERAAKARK